MQLSWIICHLSIVSAIPLYPSSQSFARIWRIVNTNDTEANLDHHDYRENQEQRICETKYCYQIAKKIEESRDATVDPCENFYQYACGSWNKHNPIPDNKVEWSEDEIKANKTNNRIREILSEGDKSTDILPVKMAKKFYRSCMDVDAIEKRGIKPIQEILDRTGGWPVAMPFNKWDPDKTPWQRIDKEYMILIGNSAFYNLEYEIDLNNTKRYVLTIDQATEYPLSRKRLFVNMFEMFLYDDDQYTLGIFRMIQAFAREKGYVLNRRHLIIDVVEMLYFELELLEIIENGKESHTVSDNFERMTIEQLQKWYDNSGVNTSTAKIDFLEMIQYSFKVANIDINSSEPIIVYNPIFLHKLATLLGKTSRRVLVNYVQWNMIDKFLLYTTQEMRDIKFEMSLSSYNVSNFIPRWEICANNIRMKNAVSYMFVKEYISDNVIHQATKMVEGMKEELGHRINRTHWLSSSIKEKLMEKLDNLQTQIGYPDWYKDNAAVIRYYDGLQIGSDYFQNILNCEKNELLKSLTEFRETVIRDKWLDFPITVNAFYAQIINSIIIPAAELQDPYFTHILPDAINYGTIGFVIGHELSHSFDNEGIRFDKEGYKIPWNSKNISEEFEEQSMCFVDQYNNYILDVTDENGEPFKLNGYLTEDENMADSIGIQIAYSTYKKIAKQKPQTKLPGLENITNDELFFLSFANSWCSSTRPEYEADMVNKDEHSPAKYRIIGSLSNMAAFSKTFKCSRNSPMNRRHKCTFWN
ncbi:membrane metallo-endopeptidase-like 1 isoform X2 [Apis cerana]|uniref:membrane metallo-endopeptidase-like 1 isoform X2 n=1 Tax=Apis cerana TaxID=7461 RepID=UPI002B222773|nr:membrane metallo-endopeptidase-like 1 isoform X2 [Apis cerana]